MPSVNKIIISAAGSGKTTRIVTEALKAPDRKIAVVTYTLNNIGEIKKKFCDANGCIPQNVVVKPWFSFLLSDFVRPYQNFVYDARRIESLAFVEGRSAQYVSRSNVARYYFSEGKNIYNDKISEFACLCNEKSGGLVIDRVESLYDHIYIDEVQDLAGYDLELIELLLKSEIDTTLVGDHRQATYKTNASNKNARYNGAKIVDKFAEWEKQGRCSVENIPTNHRCHQSICTISNLIYSDSVETTSGNQEITGHDGVFTVPSDQVYEYIKRYEPQILRYDSKTNCAGYDAINFGDSKGLTFERVLIFPHGPLRKLLETGNFEHISKSAAKVYVAITRARSSVAFVYDGVCNLDNVAKYNTTL